VVGHGASEGVALQPFAGDRFVCQAQVAEDEGGGQEVVGVGVRVVAPLEVRDGTGEDVGVDGGAGGAGP